MIALCGSTNECVVSSLEQLSVDASALTKTLYFVCRTVLSVPAPDSKTSASTDESEKEKEKEKKKVEVEQLVLAVSCEALRNSSVCFEMPHVVAAVYVVDEAHAQNDCAHSDLKSLRSFVGPNAPIITFGASIVASQPKPQEQQPQQQPEATPSEAQEAKADENKEDSKPTEASTSTTSTSFVHASTAIPSTQHE